MKLLVGNWKMAPDTSALAIALAKKTATIAKNYKKTIEVVACVPFVHLFPVIKNAKTLPVGVQTVAPTTAIASTGMVSAAMVKAIGVKYGIVGHSESREQGETNQMVHESLLRLIEKKITPILCVGEKSRDTHGWYLSLVKDQITSALADISKNTIKQLVIAYEPVWAIGVDAEREATAAECKEMIIFIRKIIADMHDEKVANVVRVLYGGSVNEQNASYFIKEGGADGLLVGRVSLDAKRFGLLARAIA